MIMLVIGLTGGMGSGKSTVTDLFAKKGIPIIDADQIAHALTEPDQPAFKKIIVRFGKQLLDETGRLNRHALKEIIFKSPPDRSWLEQLLHPLILQQIQQTLKTLSASYCIVVIPLLIETGPYTFIDRILVIDAPETIQTNRIINQNNFKPPKTTPI